MKKLTDIISPLSWACVNLAASVGIYLIFKPTLREFGIFLLVEFVVYLPLFFLGDKVYQKIFPKSRDFLFGLRDEYAGCLTNDERIRLFNALIRFPKQRAVFVFVVSFIKIIPSAIIIVFIWQYDGHPFLQAMKILAAGFMSFSYFYAVVLIENHDFISQLIATLHKKFDWSEVFEKWQIKSLRSDFNSQENIAMVFIWVFMLVLQALTVVTNGDDYVKSLWQITFVAVMGLGLISRIWFLNRRYFRGGLEGIFNAFQNFSGSNELERVPLHSSPLLARFEKTFNSLIRSVKRYEQELAQWILSQSESSRFSTLGEIAGLIVHDLSGPLHVIHFCAEQLCENPALLENPKYLNNLSRNSQRSLELVDSLRSYLRGEAGSKKNLEISFGEALSATIRLCETRFSTQGFDGIRIQLDERLNEYVVQMTRADLIHVLFNLLGNAIENLLGNKIYLPELSVRLQDAGPDHLTVCVQDNGTGLDSETFEILTGYHYARSRLADNRKLEGLGLRLVRRLVEHYNGSLLAQGRGDGKSGTAMQLRLKTIFLSGNRGTTEFPSISPPR